MTPLFWAKIDLEWNRKGEGTEGMSQVVGRKREWEADIVDEHGSNSSQTRKKTSQAIGENSSLNPGVEDGLQRRKEKVVRGYF